MDNRANRTGSGIEPTIGLGLLLVRVVTGVVFFMHGWQKLVDNGIGQTQIGFDGMGAPVPDISAVIVTFVELIGGIALILGALTQIAGILLTIDMVSALFIVHIENGFFVANMGYELVFLLGGAALGLALTGPGPFAIDRMVGTSRLPSAVTRDRVSERA